LATVVSTTSETGFESLAITSPADCEVRGGDGEAGDDDYPAIPALGPFGLLAVILTLMFTGMIILRKRLS